VQEAFSQHTRDPTLIKRLLQEGEEGLTGLPDLLEGLRAVRVH
jgi:hypothetical protein